MQYREQELRYDSDEFEAETESVRKLSENKQYKQKRSAHPKRRRAPSASHPGCGIGSRRNRRWSW